MLPAPPLNAAAVDFQTVFGIESSSGFACHSIRVFDDLLFDERFRAARFYGRDHLSTP